MRWVNIIKYYIEILGRTFIVAFIIVILHELELIYADDISFAMVTMIMGLWIFIPVMNAILYIYRDKPKRKRKRRKGK